MAEPSWTTVFELGWERIAHAFPNWILRRVYPRNKLSRRLLVYTTGGISGGPQFYITPGRPFAIETNEIIVINLLPFSVDLENMRVELLLGGMQLGSKETTLSRPIARMTAEEINLRFELSDNQAQMARNYEGPPILQMGITANFRTHCGLVPLRYDVRIRGVLYKIVRRLRAVSESAAH
jgi:hypothetical protein